MQIFYQPDFLLKLQEQSVQLRLLNADTHNHQGARRYAELRDGPFRLHSPHLRHHNLTIRGNHLDDRADSHGWLQELSGDYLTEQKTVLIRPTSGLPAAVAGDAALLPKEPREGEASP